MPTKFAMRLLAGTAVSALIAGASFAAEAEARPFDIPQQDAATALQAFAMQSGRQVLFPYEAAKGKKAPEIKGDYSDEEVLALLASSAGLKVTADDGKTVTLRPQFAAAVDGGSDGTVEALIVTAQKREEDIQDVPIAISAFTQEDLTRSQVAGGPDLITQVPNMTFTKTNFSSYSVQIRGIGTQAISATTDPAVAVAFNNTPFIRNRFFEQEFYDLQRVEVLRGPQGTLYGRNATAGVVNIISQKPRFTAESKLSGDVSNFNSSRIEGMINIPLVEDKVALRIAGAWTKRDGYATNELTGNPIDGRDLWSTRVTLRVSPNDRIDANLIWEHFEEDDDRIRSGKQLCKKHVVTEVAGIPVDYFQSLPDRGQGALLSGVQPTFSQGCIRESLYSPESYQTPMGLMLPYYYPLSYISLPAALDDPYLNNFQSPDLRVIEATIDPTYRASADIGELQVSVDLNDHLTLTSETAYGVDFVYSLQDFNRFNTAPGAWDQPSFRREGLLLPGPDGGIFCDPQLGCSDRLVAVDISTATARQFSQEFRLGSDYDGPFNFSLGANYLRADSEDKYYIFFNSITMVAADALGANYSGAYVPNVTDNIECMRNGYAPGDPNGVYEVTGCIYIDPNPIDQVNDLGHNYFLSKNPYKLISYAVFGEAYYKVTEALKITAGLRYTVDKKDAPRVPTWILANDSVGYPVAEVIEQEWREPTGRLAIDWKPDLAFTDETLVYLSFAHGYKAGGANPPGYVRSIYANPVIAQRQTEASATRPKVFDPEFVNAYEFGAKNTLLDGRLTANLAAFYYDYTGYQVSEIVDRSAFNRNFDATVWGLEIEADWRPLENLKLGFKGGYEDTRIKDGEQAVDLMDRTAGDPDWVVVRPFPTYASSCILPTYVFNMNGVLKNPGGASGGNPTACEVAYVLGLDPVTNAPYGEITDPNQFPGPFTGYTGYPGFDPLSAPNNGEGFYKQLGGNALPNAPNWTGTITADYTVSLPNEWLATLHTDLHWQSESWWRVFNDHEYNRLDEYFTMNLAAIFTNEEAGWNIMAYIKNVTDVTAITGAFLNSDDTGLTTNVFLTEPRLYGLRVTKLWTGAPLLFGLGGRNEGPFPLTVELGGQVQRHDAPNAALQPSFASAFVEPFDIFDDAQEQDLDWGDGRDVKVTWRPNAGPWSVSGGVRFGKTNNVAKPVAQSVAGGDCIFGGYYSFICAYYGPESKYYEYAYPHMTNHVEAHVTDREEHQLIDFTVGRDMGFGGLSRSKVSAGIRHARLESTTKARLFGTPDWSIPEGLYLPGYLATHSVFDARIESRREFEGFGPTISWEAAFPLLSGNDGRVDVDWSLGAGLLMGDRETEISGTELTYYYELTAFELLAPTGPPLPTSTTTSAFTLPSRSDSVTVPTYAASLGLSYSVGAFSVGAGYRWEHFADVIDGGYTAEQEEDRTIDGPYFKLSLGFGG
jgi:outer membrane receptor protein involved in Fe transport